jgi:hypothetical protein
MNHEKMSGSLFIEIKSMKCSVILKERVKPLNPRGYVGLDQYDSNELLLFSSEDITFQAS